MTDPIAALMENEGLTFPEAVERLARVGGGMTTYPVHPAAALFPMMSEPELGDLAADIKANGLIHPIMIGTWDVDGKKVEGLIDGRNRLNACQIAEIEPRFDRLNGQDPLAYIMSANVERRSLTAGQKAIATALVYPEAEKGGRGKKTIVTHNSFDRSMLSNARAIVQWSRQAALDVLNGATSFDSALKAAGDARKAANLRATQINRLRDEAVDLAEAVQRDELTPDQAIAKLDELIELERQIKENQQRTMIDLTQSAYQSLCGWVSDEFSDSVIASLADASFAAKMAFLVRLKPSNLDDLEHGLENLMRALCALAETGK